MLDFKTITPKDKSLYTPYLHSVRNRGCELTFANLCSWGHQQATVYNQHMVLFSCFNSHYMYPYPVGCGDKKPVLDAIIADAKERKIPLRLTSLNEEAKNTLENLYPGQFRFYFNPDSFDYVYDINDLADLSGRKYHRKRNHYKRFQKNFPDYSVKPINATLLPEIKEFCLQWYENKITENPDSDFEMEQTALSRILDSYDALGMEGLALYNNERLLAITLGSQMTSDTFDVQFEKALSDTDGAYAAINLEFAKYIREKYPHIRYLDREEDMGIEGLRKAKQSYYPHHQIEKYSAVLLEN